MGKTAAVVSFATTVVDATCPVTNPNPDTMNNVFKASWQNSKDNLDALTRDNHGAVIFRDYVENCGTAATMLKSRTRRCRMPARSEGPPCFTTTSPHFVGGNGGVGAHLGDQRRREGQEQLADR